MKKISLLLAGVLLCTLVFARGIDGPVKGSSVAVTNVVGSTLYKVYYKSERPGTGKVSIFDDQDNLIYNEIQSIKGAFAQVYNLKDIKSFSIEVTDKWGVVKKVTY